MSLQILIGDTPNNLSTSLTQFFGPLPGRSDVSTGETLVRVPVRPGTAAKLRIELDTAPGGTAERAFTVMRSGVATDVTLSIVGSSLSGAADVADAAAFTDGQFLSIRSVPTGVPAAARVVAYSLEWTPDTEDESIYTQHINNNLVGAGTHYRPLFGGARSASPDVAYSVVAIPGDTVHVRVVLNGNPGVGNGWNFLVRQNGIDQDGTGGTVDTTFSVVNATTGVMTATLPGAVGDRLELKSVQVGSPAGWSMSHCAAFVSDTPGAFMIPVTDTSAAANTATRYNWSTTRYVLQAWDATESNRQIKWLSEAVAKFTAFAFRLSTAPTAGKSYAIGAGVNGTYTLEDTVSDSNVDGLATGDVPLAAGNLLSARSVPSGSPTQASINYTLGVSTAEAENQPPLVDAGPNQTIPFTGGATLAGSATDDGLPDPPAALDVSWSVVFASSPVTFADDTDPTTTITFSLPGVYVLRLTADDGEFAVWDEVTITVLEPIIVDDTCQGVSPGPSICGPENVLAWVEQTQRQTDGSSVTRVTTDAAGLNDPSDYYFGRKEPRVLGWGEITRQLSDVRGQWQGSTMTWREAEVDRAVRGRYGAALTYPVQNTTDVCRMIRDSQHLAREDARLMFIGHRLRSTPAEDLSIEHESGDQLARDLEMAGKEIEAPRRRFSLTRIPGLPHDLEGVPEPIVYGKESDELSDATPPTMIADAEWGGFMEETVFANHGWAPMPGPLPPSSLTLSTEAGGSIDEDDLPGNLAYVTIVGRNAAGEWGDPYAYAYITPSAVDSVGISGTGRKVKVEWTNPGTHTAELWRVAFGLNFFGVRYTQVIEVAGTVETCEFDNAPDFDEFTLNDYSQIATGAMTNPFGGFAYYHASARMPDGRLTALAPVAGFNVFTIYPRWSRIEATDVPAGATEVVFFQFAPGLPATHPDAVADFAWEVPASQVTAAGHVYLDIERTEAEVWGHDMVLGLSVPRERGAMDLVPYYSGLELCPFDGQHYARWIVASHAVHSIRGLYVDGRKIGTDEFHWQFRGQDTFVERFGGQDWVDLGGRRYTVIRGLATHPDVAACMPGGTVTETETLVYTLRANVWGVETAADSTGILIVDIHDQFKHWMINFGPLGDYQTGAWLTAPTWAPIAEHCKINAQSWDDRRDEAIEALGMTIVGGGVLREARPMRDWLARWLVSTDTRIGQNAAGQWTLSRHVPGTTPVATFTEIRNIQGRSVTFTPLHDEHWTWIPYRYAQDSEGQWQEASVVATDEEDDYGTRYPGPVFELFFVQSLAVASWLMGNVRDRHKTLPWRVAVETIDLCGTNVDNGSVIGLTGSWGLGADGWQAFPIFLEWHTVLAEVQRTRLTGRMNVAPQEAIA